MRASAVFVSPAPGPLTQLVHLIIGKGSFAAAVGAALLGQRDALALALTDQRSLKLGERTHHGQQQGGHRRVLTGEGELFGDELHLHALGGQLTHDPAQIVEIASKSIHGMHEHYVTLTHEAEHRR